MTQVTIEWPEGPSWAVSLDGESFIEISRPVTADDEGRIKELFAEREQRIADGQFVPLTIARRFFEMVPGKVVFEEITANQQ